MGCALLQFLTGKEVDVVQILVQVPHGLFAKVYATGEILSLVDIERVPLEVVIALEFTVVEVDLGLCVLLDAVFAQMGQEELDVKLQVKFVPLEQNRVYLGEQSVDQRGGVLVFRLDRLGHML